MTQQTQLLSELEAYLRLTSTREKIVAGNLANVDTPGYHTQDIDFQGELARAMRPQMSDVAGGSSLQTEPVVREVPGLMERADGNNVDLDREGLTMAAVQLQYQMGVQLIKDQFHQILSAINGGN